MASFNSKDYDGNKVGVAVQHTAAGDDVQLIQAGIGVDNSVVPVDNANPLPVAVQSTSAADRNNDTISTAVQTGVISVGTLAGGGITSLTPKFKFANLAASTTDGAVVAAVTSKKIRVLSFRLHAAATATNGTFTSKPAGAGTAISELFALGINGGRAEAFSPVGHFETVSGEGLSFTTGTGSTVGVGVVYVEV